MRWSSLWQWSFRRSGLLDRVVFSTEWSSCVSSMAPVLSKTWLTWKHSLGETSPSGSLSAGNSVHHLGHLQPGIQFNIQVICGYRFQFIIRINFSWEIPSRHPGYQASRLSGTRVIRHPGYQPEIPSRSWLAGHMPTDTQGLNICLRNRRACHMPTELQGLLSHMWVVWPAITQRRFNRGGRISQHL